ncbi:MAG: hypothetical protein KJO77_05260 [Bacteroidia bacterium]|nr:hypothetical protein [Bacteroidia bacterium]NND53271.1 hypothetical protein [Flavobacteriaceae bacterium]
MRHLLTIIGFAFALSLSSCATHVAVRPAPHVKVVKVAPKHHKIVVVKGKRYYYWNGRHHKKTAKGFVVVKVK